GVSRSNGSETPCALTTFLPGPLQREEGPGLQDREHAVRLDVRLEVLPVSEYDRPPLLLREELRSRSSSRMPRPRTNRAPSRGISPHLISRVRLKTVVPVFFGGATFTGMDGAPGDPCHPDSITSPRGLRLATVAAFRGPAPVIPRGDSETRARRSLPSRAVAW